MATIKFPFDHVNIATAEEFRAKAGQAGYDLPVSDNLRALREPLMADGHRIGNSMAVQPLEGLDATEDGAPSSLTLARYEKLAAQGAGILWVEATAIVPEGRDSLRQLWLHAGSAAGFRDLVRTIDTAAVAAGHQPPYKVLQLTHSGRCSVNASGAPAPQAAFASPYLDPVMGTPQIVTDEYLDQLQDRLGEAAALAADAGFDAVELKLCHQYLFKELLCAYTRSGKYGGSQENRFRFALNAVDQIHRRVGNRIDVVVRLNAYDGIPWPYGWGMAQPNGKPTVAESIHRASPLDDIPTNWAGNPQFVPAACQNCTAAPAACASCSVASNWHGNPHYAQITAGAPSNWPGNPAPLNISDEEKSSWQGNPQYQQITAGTPSNWQGNPDYTWIRGAAGSTWFGNPARQDINGTAVSNWSGNPQFMPAACQNCTAAPAACASCSVASNWQGNPAPLNISEGEKSSWQGNPARQDISGTAASNWPGNQQVVPAACVGCQSYPTACSGCTVASNWQGNQEFVPTVCAGCTSPHTNCAVCAIASNWQGNPQFMPAACQNCTAAPAACASCAVASNWQGNPQFMPAACQNCTAVPSMPAASAPTSLVPGPMQIDLTEVKELMQQLYRKGVRIFNLSTNSPRFAPAGNGYLNNFSDTAEVDPYAGVASLLAATKEIRSTMPPDLKIVGTGLSWFGPFGANVAAGGIEQGWFDIAGFGRSVMADNDFIPAILQGRQPGQTSLCIGCDRCFQLFFAGLPTGCAVCHKAYRDLYETACAQGRIDGSVIL